MFISRLFPMWERLFFGFGIDGEEGSAGPADDASGGDNQGAGDNSSGDDQQGAGEGQGEENQDAGNDGGNTDDLPDNFDPKRAVAENKRKGEKIQTLEKELADLRAKVEGAAPRAPEKPQDALETAYSVPEVRKGLDRLKERMGLDDDDIRSLLSVMGYQADTVAGRRFAPVAEQFAGQKLQAVVKELAQDDDYKFIIEKYGPEIEQTLKAKKINPEYWGNKDIVEAMLGIVTKNHLKDIIKAPAKKIDRAVMQEGRPNQVSSLPAGINAQELHRYASEIGYTSDDLKDKAVMKSVIAAFNARKAAKNS